MKRSVIKKVAVSLAFLQLFSSSIGLSKSHADSTEYVLVDNSNVPIYQRVDSETGELKPISIFDDENILTRQYGASQRVFKTKVDDLLKDPIIWDELQKYYPVENFECMDDALFFYEKYLYILYDSGCGYAAAADFVFRLFEGREAEFYETFGYPMYTYVDGKLDFNYEAFMLKFFNFYNLDQRKDFESIDKWILKDFYQHQVFRLAADTEYKKPYKAKNYKLTDEEWEEYKRLEAEHEAKFDEVNEKYKNAKKERVNMGIRLDACYGYLYMYLAFHGISISTYYEDNAKKLEENDIIACDKFRLLEVNKDGEVTKEQDCGLHYVYVVDIDGKKVIVSSWGKKYIFENTYGQDVSVVKEVVN